MATKPYTDIDDVSTESPPPEDPLGSASPSGQASPLPTLADLGRDLRHLTWFQRWGTLAIPFLCVAAYTIFAVWGWWAAAVGALMYLSFSTYGSISHDLVHRNLGLSARVNTILLCLIELLAIRSGHAYRVSHLNHHRRFPGTDDLEGAAAGMTWFQSLVDGLSLQIRIFRWSLAQADGPERRWIVSEGCAGGALVCAAFALIPWTLAPLLYVVLMTMGAWVIPLITSTIPHDPTGRDPLHQTRRFRGVVASLVALEHLYHLEHHLYPAVPHHHWPRLARRLDPHLDRLGIVPVRFWF